MQNHFIHFVFTALPFIILLFLVLKKVQFTLLQKLILAILVLFMLLHAGPFTQAFAYHHQTQSAGEHHPCCMHQLTSIVEIFTVTFAVVAAIYVIVTRPLAHKPVVAFAYSTRAPPAYM